MPGKHGIVTFLLVIDFRFVYSVKLSRETVDAEEIIYKMFLRLRTKGMM